jgi:hypothetical protein
MLSGLLAAGGAQAQETKGSAASSVVTETGEARIVAGDISNAKENARNDALRKAVQKVVGTYVTSFSEAQNYTLMQDLVATHTTGYVSSFDILETKVNEEDGTVSVTVQATVAKGALDAQAAKISTLVALKKQKRVYVMVNDLSDETKKGGGEELRVRHGIFDGLLREALRSDGFFTLDPNVVDGNLKVKSAISTVNNLKEGAEIATAVQADVIIYGHVTTKLADQKGADAVYMASAEINLSITTPDASEEIGGYQETIDGRAYFPEKAVTTALRNGAAAAVKGVRTKLFEAWSKQLEKAQRIKITISGIKDFSVFRKVQAAISNHVPGAQGISSQRLEKGVGTFDLMYKNGTNALANALSEKTIAGLSFSVTGLTPNTLEATLTK